ncbi:MAG: hypothetical protein GXP47_02185 [Acidobacteria bacterium]|nr:hypothetical protein [Acidobacteriota bacterium]
MTESERELAYYRAVEDLFAELRGTPHVLSPRDFQLLRTWWRDDVPLAAVTAGIAEVFARRRETGEDDPVLSLSYCRHAVRRAAKRLAESRAGSSDDATGDRESLRPVLERLDRHLERAATAQLEARPAVAHCLQSIRSSLSELAGIEDPELVEDGLFSLETALLEGCWNALDRATQNEILARARRAAGEVDGPAGRRAVRAHRDRELRILLDLPRLELP